MSSIPVIHKIKCFLIALFLLGILNESRAQYMEFQWSDEYRYTNRKTGFFTDYIGSSLTSIFLLQRNIVKTKPYDNSKLQILALNKNAMSKDTVISLKGFPENEDKAEQLAELDFVQAMAGEAGVFVFWRKISTVAFTRTEEIFAQQFGSNLKPVVPITKIFEFSYPAEDGTSIFDSSKSIIVTQLESDQLVVGHETTQDGERSFQYVVLESGLSPSSTKNIPLPAGSKKKDLTIPDEYMLQKNGILLIKSTGSYSKEEIYLKGPNHPKTYLELTAANIQTSNHAIFKLGDDEKVITDVECHDHHGKTRLTGFFGDLQKDTTGKDDQGVFYADIDPNTLKTDGINYVYLSRTMKNRMMSKKRLKKRISELSPEEINHARYDIEHIESMPDSSSIIFFTLEYNFKEKTSKSNLNGENVYSTQAYFNKSDVFALRLSKSGEILWARSMERRATYEGHDKKDIQIVYAHEKFIVLFGNEHAKLKPPRKKKLRHLTEEVEYATFDPNSGRAKIYTAAINEKKTAQKDKHYVDPNSPVVIDDQFYFYKMHVRQHPLWTAANVLFVPTLYYTILTGNTKVGKGDFTRMRVMKGKKPRRKK